MQVRFPYHGNSWMPEAPIIDIEVAFPFVLGSTAQSCPALVDTGADITVLPASIIQELGLLEVDELEVQGYDQVEPSLTLAYSAVITVPVLGNVTLKVVGHDNAYALLGRDVLNNLVLLLDGPQKEFEIR